MKVFTCILFFLMALMNTSGQTIRDYDLEMQAKHAELKGYDSLYRVNYFENIVLRSEFTSNIPKFELQLEPTGKTVEIRSASEYQIGFSMDYKWISIGIGFAPNFLIGSEDLQEIENSTSFAMNINFFYSDRWRQELKYSYYRGFFSDSAIDDKELGLQLKNTTINAIAGSTFFIENRNYSFRAHYAQTERQLKSAGSLIPRIIYVYSVTGTNPDPDQNEDQDLNSINSFDILAQLGYLYTFVYNKKWFATIGIYTGLGYNSSKYKFESNDVSETKFNNLIFATESELSMGYNSYRWFFGTSLKLRNYNYSNSDSDEFRGISEYFSIHLGYRLNDNKPMRKFFGWFEDHLGF